MDILPIILITAICTAIAAIPYWLFNRWTKSRIQQSVFNFSQHFGLTPSPASEESSLPSAAGRYRNRPTSILSSYTTQGPSFPMTRLTVEVYPPVSFEIRLIANSFLSSSPDEKYVPFGEEELDNALLLATNDKELTSKLFTKAIQVSLKKALAKGLQRGELVITKSEFRYTDPQHMMTEGDLALNSHMVELLHDLADRVEELRSS